MTDEELTQLEALERAATPGPWSEFCESGDWWISQQDEFDGPNEWVCNSNREFWAKQEDTDLTVAARNALPSLIAEVRRLRAIIAMIDQHAPLADGSCDQPGITLSEAARRMIQEVQP